VVNQKLSKLNNSPQLARAAVQVSGSGLDAAVPSKRFEQVNCSALVGKVCEERSASAVAASAFKPSAFVKQGKRL
jgi:K+-transporting ATPase c subunit